MQRDNTPQFPTTATINAVIAKAENNGNSELADALRTLFSMEKSEAFSEPDNRPVTERIKTFEDAVAAIGKKHPLVCQYYDLNDVDADLNAYLKLRIITIALNEGWTPQFTEGEWRYFPQFRLFDAEEIAYINEAQRSRLVYRPNNSARPYVGIIAAERDCESDRASTKISSRLAFKSSELAIYAGQQFTEIYANILFGLK